MSITILSKHWVSIDPREKYYNFPDSFLTHEKSKKY